MSQEVFRKIHSSICKGYKALDPGNSRFMIHDLASAPDRITPAIQGSPREPGMYLWPVTASTHSEAWVIAKRRHWFSGVDRRLVPARSRGKYWFQSKVHPNVA